MYPLCVVKTVRAAANANPKEHAIAAIPSGLCHWSTRIISFNTSNEAMLAPAQRNSAASAILILSAPAVS
jgi:hypothetical protein